MPCNKFGCFGDLRGIHATNPACECPGVPFSRLQVAGNNGQQAMPRALYYTCPIGECEFFMYVVDEEGNVLLYTGTNLSAEYLASSGL